MAERDDGQERNLDPTPQRIERARSDGDVAVSQDLHVFASYLGLFLALGISAGAMAAGFAEPLSLFLSAPHGMWRQLLEPGGAAIIGDLLGQALGALAPLYLLPLIGVLLSLLAQRAIVFAPKKLAPKLSRVNPISVAAQKFGPSGLVEFAKSVTKLCLIAAALGMILYFRHDGVVGLLELDARALPELMLYEILLILGAALVVAALMAGLDVLWQQYSYIQKLKMSQQEMRDETKNTEGDPHMKQERRARAQRIAMSRMIEDVPTADVVIVNPTHYAVALKWTRDPGSAPVCVAKGVDRIAARIREIAEENAVPIHSDPPTARLLHGVVEIGDEIRPEHYQAVAVAIRFAEGVRKKAALHGPGWRGAPADR